MRYELSATCCPDGLSDCPRWVVLQQFTVYATGTPANFADRPEIESMLDRCAKDGYRIRDLILALVESKIFLGPPGSQ